MFDFNPQRARKVASFDDNFLSIKNAISTLISDKNSGGCTSENPCCDCKTFADEVEGFQYDESKCYHNQWVYDGGAMSKEIDFRINHQFTNEEIESYEFEKFYDEPGLFPHPPLDEPCHGMMDVESKHYFLLWLDGDHLNVAVDGKFCIYSIPSYSLLLPLGQFNLNEISIDEVAIACLGLCKTYRERSNLIEIMKLHGKVIGDTQKKLV